MQMTEKRYDVIDKLEPRGQSVTDGGIPCTARTCVTRLNRLTEENEQLKNINGIHRSALLDSEYDIKKLKAENEQLKLRIKELEERNKRQYDSLKKISDLMYVRDWKTLDGIVEDWEESDRLLKEIHWCFEKEIQRW